jgi:hypothetical protein
MASFGRFWPKAAMERASAWVARSQSEAHSVQRSEPIRCNEELPMLRI